MMRTLLPLLVLWMMSPGRAGEVKSFYSTTAPKFVALVESSDFEEEPEIDHFRAVCPGYGGYELIHEGGDARSWINVRHGDRTSDLFAETMRRARGGFPVKANDVVEWRGELEDGVFKPYAIIYRIAASDPEPGGEDRTTLIVIALNEGRSEVLGSAHGTDEDRRAKAIADEWWKKRE